MSRSACLSWTMTLPTLMILSGVLAFEMNAMKMMMMRRRIRRRRCWLWWLWPSANNESRCGTVSLKDAEDGLNQFQVDLIDKGIPAGRLEGEFEVRGGGGRGRKRGAAAGGVTGTRSFRRIRVFLHLSSSRPRTTRDCMDQRDLSGHWSDLTTPLSSSSHLLSTAILLLLLLVLPSASSSSSCCCSPGSSSLLCPHSYLRCPA